jgi:hypothetical protein
VRRSAQRNDEVGGGLDAGALHEKEHDVEGGSKCDGFDSSVSARAA